MDYIAPEQAENAAQVDPRSDIYSLGCTLYFALTGKPPFAGGTPLEKIQRHRSEEPTPIPQLNPNVHPAFIGLVRKMMARRPEQRFASAADLQEALLGWASHDPVLPLDRPGDPEYTEAVVHLETVEAPPELSPELIPVGKLEPARDSGAWATTQSPVEGPEEPTAKRRSLWSEAKTVLGYALLILVSFALGCSLYLLLALY
jgi:serine/threonine protein kinase